MRKGWRDVGAPEEREFPAAARTRVGAFGLLGDVVEVLGGEVACVGEGAVRRVPSTISTSAETGREKAEAFSTPARTEAAG